MAETTAIIDTLKKALKDSQLTYAAVAKGLNMSEANIKRMFAAERMTLDRIEAICQLMNMKLSDLFERYEKSRQRITELTDDQEQELMADRQLLFVAVCIRNHLTFREILKHYHIEETDLIQCLAKLDRLKIIDLLPNNHIKLRIDENFRWKANGPIERFYEQAIQNEFLDKGFDADANPRIFVYGMLSEQSHAVVAQRIKLLAHDVTQLHRQDRDLPLNKRHNIGVLLAVKEWNFSIFRSYLK